MLPWVPAWELLSIFFLQGSSEESHLQVISLLFFVFAFWEQSFSYRVVGVSPGGFKPWQPVAGRGRFLSSHCCMLAAHRDVVGA